MLEVMPHTPRMWKDLPAAQQPRWPDRALLADCVGTLASLPALVFAGETRSLRQDLVEAAAGRAFVLQCGDCAEEFSRCHGPAIHRLLNVFLQMSAVLCYAGRKRVIRIGRIAGQYAKPRSSDTETVNGLALPSYRGDMVNGIEPTIANRTPNPQRLVEAYFRSAATLNLIRAFTRGGYAAWDFAERWQDGFVLETDTARKYKELMAHVQQALCFFRNLGGDLHNPLFTEATLYTSHEALILEYEDAMTRVDTTTNRLYNTSAHMLWLGDRTRQADGAHVAYAGTLNNPIGIKVGPNFDIEELARAIRTINPRNEEGKVVVITRFGATRIAALLPSLIRGIAREQLNVIWLCDPMHGNTFLSASNVKTRALDDVLAEVEAFFRIHAGEGTVPAGIHLEITGDNVTECVGGLSNVSDSALHTRYHTACDPRLNASQALELAFATAHLITQCGTATSATP